MIYKNVELHNVEEVKNQNGGVFLYRFPLDVIDILKDQSAVASRADVGCEIRFFTSAKRIWVTLEAIANNADITVCCGDFVYKNIKLEADRKTTVELCYNTRFDQFDKDYFTSFEQRFPINLWRVCINEGYNIILYDVCGLDGAVRPPYENEINLKKWLAYGSSITHGYAAFDMANSYVQHAARLLNVDVLCKGMSGACLCEKEMANYIANLDWDFATLELGINMMSFKTKDFKKRAVNLIETVHRENTDKKVFVISQYRSFRSDGSNKDYKDKYMDYVTTLEETVNNISSENVVYISGNDILTSPTYLSADFLHPSTFGHVRMADNLYRILKDRI